MGCLRVCPGCGSQYSEEKFISGGHKCTETKTPVAYELRDMKGAGYIYHVPSSKALTLVRTVELLNDKDQMIEAMEGDIVLLQAKAEEKTREFKKAIGG